MTKRYAPGKIKTRAEGYGTYEPLTQLQRSVETGSQAISASIEGTKKTIQAGVEGVSGITKTAQSSLQSVIQPATQALDALGNVQESISQPISGVVNGVTKMANGIMSFVGKEKILEDDDFSGVTEFVTDTFLGTAGHAIQAIDANLHSMIGVADGDNAAKGLIKLQEKGDLACDRSKGKLRMMIELPGIARQYNICIDSRTAKNVMKQVSANPMIPLMNFGNCLLSEGVLKPIDHVVRDAKNIIADMVTIGKRPSDITGNLMNAFTNISKIIHKGLSREYLIDAGDLVDTAACFQIKTNNDPGMEYTIVDVPHFMESIVSTQFMSGQRMNVSPFARKNDRNRCNEHDMCKI